MRAPSMHDTSGMTDAAVRRPKWGTPRSAQLFKNHLVDCGARPFFSMISRGGQRF
jgi:hypothetical protein